MNVITIAGIVGKDAEMRYMNDGTAIAGFSLADSQGKDKTVWWNCNLFGKRAEALGQYILKGTKVTVSGQVTEESWTDKNGQERKTMKVRVNDVALQSKAQESHAAPAPAPAQADIDETDVPF